MQNNAISNKRLFVGDFSSAFTCFAKKRGANHYDINSLLYKNTQRKICKNV